MRASTHGRGRILRRLPATVIPLALLGAGLLAVTPAMTPAAIPVAAAASAPSHPGFKNACGTASPAKYHCLAIENTTAHPDAKNVRPGVTPLDGYGPRELQAAYGLTSASAADGAGSTVAIVDAYDDPTAVGDLAAYRAAAGLPALKPGQFTRYNQYGKTAPLPRKAPFSDDWNIEESLDLDMVSAICPHCKIDLVEADDDNGNGLFIAEQAAAITLGAKYISNSWGGSELAADTRYDTMYFGVPGVVYTAASGDLGYGDGTSYPAASPNVVSVGGTTLNAASNARGWTESVWGSHAAGATVGTGSGCTTYEPQPARQAAIKLITAACGKRVENDVAAVADPSTGAAIYDTSNGYQGWLEVGGTSESSPIIAAVYALAGHNGNNAADSIYTHTGALNEVTGGSNGICTPPAAAAVLCAATGAAHTYNGPTGWGTPHGLAAFRSTTGTGQKVTVATPGDQTSKAGNTISLKIHATDSVGGRKLTYSADGLPQGLSINPSTGVISGKITHDGVSNVTIVVKDSAGGRAVTFFVWTVNPVTGCIAQQLLYNPGFENGNLDGWTATEGLLGSTFMGKPAQAGDYLAWLDGRNAAATNTLAQSVSIPALCEHAAITYWVETSSTVTDKTQQAKNTLMLEILNSKGKVVQTVPVATAADNGTSYAEHTTNLTAYIGQTVTVEFVGTEAAGGDTSFYEDSNALNVS